MTNKEQLNKYLEQGGSWSPEAEEKASKEKDAIYGALFEYKGEAPIDWRKYETIHEDQQRIAFCTNYGATNVAEAMYKKRYGKEINLSDRYLGVKSKTSLTGNSLNVVLETFRKQGTVKEEYCLWRPEWLSNPHRYWKLINDLSKVSSTVKRFKIDGYSKVYPRLKQMKEALAHSPLYVGAYVGSTWENKIVYYPKGHRVGHAFMIQHIDDYMYIKDSVGSPTKKLALNYPILACRSLRQLPNNWEALNNMPLRLVKKKDEVETYAIMGSGRYWITCAESFNDLKDRGVISDWQKIDIVDKFSEPLVGVLGKMSLGGWYKYHTKIK